MDHKYKAHRTVPVGLAGGYDDLKMNANIVLGMGSKETWNATVVNPSEKGGTLQWVLLLFHLAIWLVAAGLSSAVGFETLKMNITVNGTNAYNYTEPVSQVTHDIGVMGGISMLAGVAVLVLAAAVLNAKEYKTWPLINDVIQFVTLLGTTSIAYVFCEAAAVPEENAYFLQATFALIFSVYAQLLLFSTSQTLDVKHFSRAFMPALALAIQTVLAIAFRAGQYLPSPTDAQMIISAAIPITTAVTILLVGAVRTYDKNIAKSAPALTNPFVASLIRSGFVAALMLTLYKILFLKGDPKPTSFIFSVAAAAVSGIVALQSMMPFKDDA